MSQEVRVPLKVRRAYAAPELWYAPGREVKLGCSRCPDVDRCGGLATEAPLFDCMSLCCGRPDACTRYACPRRRQYSGLVNEVNGLDLRPYTRPVAPRASLPSYLPYMPDRGSLAGPLNLDAVAIGLYSIVDRQSGLARFASRDELLAHFRLSPHTKLVITASGPDRDVENFWHVLQVKNTAESLLALRPALITTPNFSMHAGTVRHDNLVSIARIGYCFEAFAAAGLPVAPHINARTPFDFARWVEFLNRSPGVHTIAYELGTVGKSEVRRRWHVEQLVRVARSVGRPLGLVVRAGSSHLAELSAAFTSVMFVDSDPVMKAKFRQAAAVDGSSLVWQQRHTDIGHAIDEVFVHNVKVSRRFYRSRLQSVSGSAQSASH
jgi:hypothetical protein